MENKNVNETKEKMIKTCKVLKMFITLLKLLVVLGIITPIVITFMLIKPVDESAQAATGNEIVEEEDSYIGEFEEPENDWRIFPKVLLTVSIILCIEKILKEIIEKETPFTEKNIKMMELIAMSSIALSVFAKGTGVVFAMAIVIMASIFKYGYQLQIESDETL